MSIEIQLCHPFMFTDEDVDKAYQQGRADALDEVIVQIRAYQDRNKNLFMCKRDEHFEKLFHTVINAIIRRVELIKGQNDG